MFSAISHQLQTSGVCNVDSSERRQMVASHMEANAALYCGFVCQPVATDSKYNADTTDEDEDPELQTQLRWTRRLRLGSWGDNLTIQAIADIMLSLKINVLSSDYPAASITPSNSCATCEMSVGLIKQYHYVGLHKMCDSSVEGTAQNAQTATVQSTVANTDSHDTETADDALDDAVIEEGDEHRIQISGAPMASIMCVENPESLCVAPAEGEKPLNIMTDSNFEAMSNPDKFPFGVGTYSSERPRKITYYQLLMADLLETLSCPVHCRSQTSVR